MEIELKFCAAPERAALLQAAMGGSAPQRLQATYFDTADRRLARAQAALRIRREGNRWVQTAKAIAQGPWMRHEDNVDLGAVTTDRPPAADWRRHAGTPVGDQLAALLTTATTPLTATYGTDIWRTTRRCQQGAIEVELDLDVGHIEAIDAAGQHRTLPVLELEIELMGQSDANVMALAAVAEPWIRTHGLWLDTRSKAERGEWLMRGAPAWPVVPVPAVPGTGSNHLRSWLETLMGNLQVLADGQGRADHVGMAAQAADMLAETLTSDLAPLPQPPAGRCWHELAQPLQHAAHRLQAMHATADPTQEGPPVGAMAAARGLELQLALLYLQAAVSTEPPPP